MALFRAVNPLQRVHQLPHLGHSMYHLEFTIRSALPTDAGAICSIYNHYVTATNITIEDEPVTEQEIVQRIAEGSEADLPWMVLQMAQAVFGFTYAAKCNAHPAYRHSVETVICLDPMLTDRGIGSLLYSALLDELCRRNVNLVVAREVQPVEHLSGLYSKFGFNPVAHFPQACMKNGRWVDVKYWGLNLKADTDDEEGVVSAELADAVTK